MSVKSQMERLTQNIANAYAVLKALGCDMPSEQNSDNLASTAGTSKVVKYEAQSLTDAQKAQARTNIKAEAGGTAESKVSSHNTSESSHNDIRLLIEGLTNRLNALANSDDTTLDQMAEVVAYIKNNKSLIDGITTNKVSVSDIIDNLTTSVSNKPLSAKQGVQLKALIDAIVVPTLLSQLSGDANHRLVTDTQISAWNAKSTFSGKFADLSGKPTTLAGYGITDGATKQEVTQLQEQIGDYDLTIVCDYTFNKDNCKTLHMTNDNLVGDVFIKAVSNLPVRICLRNPSYGEVANADCILADGEDCTLLISFNVITYPNGEKFIVTVKLSGDELNNGYTGTLSNVTIEELVDRDTIQEMINEKFDSIVNGNEVAY